MDMCTIIKTKKGEQSTIRKNASESTVLIASTLRKVHSPRLLDMN